MQIDTGSLTCPKVSWSPVLPHKDILRKYWEIYSMQGLTCGPHTAFISIVLHLTDFMCSHLRN